MNIQGISMMVDPQQSSGNGGAGKIARDFHQLRQELFAGDLTGASQTYADLQGLLPHGTGPAAHALQAIGQALQSGDISGAQSDLRHYSWIHRHQQEVRSDIAQLSDGLSTGNLQEAQQAFAALQGLVGQRNPNGPISQALNNVGAALQNGDLSAAETAFATYMQDLKGQSQVVLDPTASMSVSA